MDLIDRFQWTIANVEGVQSTLSMPQAAKIINAGWYEGSLKWRALPRNPQTLSLSTTYIDTSTGLLDSNCRTMPVLIFTEDHKAETIDRVVRAVQAFAAVHNTERHTFRLATGNVGVMASANDVVKNAQFPMLMYIYAAVIFLCLLAYRSVRAVLCIALPLSLVSILTYALMSLLEIGLKVPTLPVTALGVGIGVDYGIYIFSGMKRLLDGGMPLKEAYVQTLRITGNAVLVTGLTLAIGTSTWILSPLKFQADMGILLTFMFLGNMLGALLLLPSLAAFILRKKPA
jgi:predicted RND superfamily exporter protein